VRKECDSIINHLCELPELKEEFIIAELESPGIKHILPPAQAIELIMEDMCSEQAKRGMQDGATLSDIRCYKGWLSRVKRGTDPNLHIPGPQGHIHDIDIKEKVLPIYRKLYQ
jgi:hypothetical protein